MAANHAVTPSASVRPAGRSRCSARPSTPLSHSAGVCIGRGEVPRRADRVEVIARSGGVVEVAFSQHPKAVPLRLRRHEAATRLARRAHVQRRPRERSDQCDGVEAGRGPQRGHDGRVGAWEGEPHARPGEHEKQRPQPEAARAVQVEVELEASRARPHTPGRRPRPPPARSMCVSRSPSPTRQRKVETYEAVQRPDQRCDAEGELAPSPQRQAVMKPVEEGHYVLRPVEKRAVAIGELDAPRVGIGPDRVEGRPSRYVAASSCSSAG